MPKAIRYKSNGKYLRNTLFWTTNSDFLGAHHGVESDAIFDPVLAAEEEALTIASHQQDFAVAFGLPTAEITCEVVAGWNGDPATLPKEDEPDALERLPVPPTIPEPDVPSFEQAALASFDPMRAVEIYAKYGLFMRMLDRGDWSGARSLLEAITTAGGITQAEHDTIVAELTKAHIP